MSLCGWLYWPLVCCCRLLSWFFARRCDVARRRLEKRPCHLKAEPSPLPSSRSEHSDPGSLSLCASVDAESKRDYEQSRGITLASVLTSFCSWECTIGVFQKANFESSTLVQAK